MYEGEVLKFEGGGWRIKLDPSCPLLLYPYPHKSGAWLAHFLVYAPDTLIQCDWDPSKSVLIIARFRDWDIYNISDYCDVKSAYIYLRYTMSIMTS